MSSCTVIFLYKLIRQMFLKFWPQFSNSLKYFFFKGFFRSIGLKHILWCLA